MQTDVQIKPIVSRGRITSVSVYVSASRSGASEDVHAFLTPEEAGELFRGYQETVYALSDKQSAKAGEN
jgi:hypothetical protein